MRGLRRDSRTFLSPGTIVPRTTAPKQLPLCTTAPYPDDYPLDNYLHKTIGPQTIPPRDYSTPPQDNSNPNPNQPTSTGGGGSCPRGRVDQE